VNVPADDLSEILVTEYPEGAAIGWPAAGQKPVSTILSPGSMYVLDGEARQAWQHSIPATKALRYSITFHTLRGDRDRVRRQRRT
jgi:alkylated DNA repair dioxygenase AlkB